ncbi:hypothetical protein UT300012_23960 [Paraclostridium bifermentans]
MVKLEDLKNSFAAPENTKYVDLNDKRFVPFEEFRELFIQGKSKGKVPKPEGVKWVGFVPNKRLYFMGLENGQIARWKDQNASFRWSEFRGDKLHTVATDNFENKKVMEEKLNNFGEADYANYISRAKVSTQRLDKKELLNNGEGKAEENKNKNTDENLLEDMNMENNNFDNAFEGADFSSLGNEFKTEGFAGTQEMNLGANATAPTGIADATDTVEVEASWLDAIANFNRDNGGCLVGFVTNNDSKININAKNQDKKKKGAGKDVAGQGALEESAAGDSASRIVNFTQSAPGKILGGVLRIPAGGLFDVTTLESGINPDTGAEVKPDYTNKTVKTMVLDNEQLSTMISLGFNSEAPECRETYGKDAGTTMTIIKEVKRKVEGSDEKVAVEELALKSTRKGSKIHRDAYLPLNVFETIDASKPNLSQEEIDALNVSAFYSFFQTTASRTTAPVKTLVHEHAKRIRFNAENDKYESDYFTLDMSAKVPVQIKPWYTNDKEAVLDSIPVQVKKLVPTKDGKSMRAQVQKINVLKDMDKPNYGQLNSLNNEKFAKFVEACDGALTLEELQKRFGKKTGSKKAKEQLATNAKNFDALRKVLKRGNDVKKMDSLFNSLKNA